MDVTVGTSSDKNGDVPLESTSGKKDIFVYGGTPTSTQSTSTATTSLTNSNSNKEKSLDVNIDFYFNKKLSSADLDRADRAVLRFGLYVALFLQCLVVPLCYGLGIRQLRAAYIAVAAIPSLYFIIWFYRWMSTCEALNRKDNFIAILWKFLWVYVPCCVCLFGGFAGWTASVYRSVTINDPVYVNAATLWNMYSTGAVDTNQGVYFPLNTFLLDNCTGTAWADSSVFSLLETTTAVTHLAPIVDCLYENKTFCDIDKTVRVFAIFGTNENGHVWDTSVRQGIITSRVLKNDKDALAEIKCPDLALPTDGEYMLVYWEPIEPFIQKARVNYLCVVIIGTVVPSLTYIWMLRFKKLRDF